MARPRSTGLKTVARKDRTDYYHRASGVYLGSDKDAAIDKAAEMDEVRPAPKLPASVFSGLCDSYLGSAQFRALSPRTKRLNTLYVEKLRRLLGPLEVRGLTRPVVFALREKWLAEISDNESKVVDGKKPSYAKGEAGPLTRTVAAHMMNKLQILFTHAKNLGIIGGENPCHGLGGFNVAGRDTQWDDTQIRAILSGTTGSVQRAAALMIYTAQRPSDCLAMTWERVTERDGLMWLSLVQQKTGALIDVPAHRDLAAILRAATTKTGLLVTAPQGGQWAYRNFARKWDLLIAKAGISGVQRRDLRRTAMVRMTEAGASPAQVAAVSGHEIHVCQKILDRYIPKTSKMAASAIAAWELVSEPCVTTPPKRHNDNKPER